MRHAPTCSCICDWQLKVRPGAFRVKFDSPSDRTQLCPAPLMSLAVCRCSSARNPSLSSQFVQLHPAICHLISVLAGVRAAAPRGEISTGRKRAVIMKRPRAERACRGLLISILIRRIRAGRTLMTSQVTVGVCKWLITQNTLGSYAC